MATAQQEIKSLKEDMAQIKDILVDHAEGTAANGASKSRSVNMDQVKEKARLFGAQAREFLNGKQEQFVTARDATEKTIKSRPFTSAAVAFTGGALIAALLSRK